MAGYRIDRGRRDVDCLEFGRPSHRRRRHVRSLSTNMTSNRRCQRQRVDGFGIAPAQNPVRRFGPAHALIERAAANRPSILAAAAAAQRMNPIDFGGGEASRSSISGKICRRNKAANYEQGYPCWAISSHERWNFRKNRFLYKPLSEPARGLSNFPTKCRDFNRIH